MTIATPTNNNNTEIFREKLIASFVEVLITGSDDFLKIRETLTRIGVVNQKTKTVYQSCHILHRRGKYYIVHFKEMFALDGKAADITEEDLDRRDAIALLIEQWGMCRMVKEFKAPESVVVFVLPFSKKKEYELVSKYKMGTK